MTKPAEQKTTNQVDHVLQGYLDQLLVTATEPLTVVEAGTAADEPAMTTVMGSVESSNPTQADDQRSERIATAERVASAELRRESTVVQEVKLERLPERHDNFVEAPALTPSFTVPQPPLTPAWPDVKHDVSTDTTVTDTVDAPTAQTEAASAPDWRSVQGVECLIFKVAGLKLAIPLSVLGGVHNRSDKVTPLFGQASWSLGVWQSDEQKLTIIDSAALIMPERRISLAEQGYDYVIQLDRSPWALACQEICETVTLVYDSIKWRGDCSKRPWLAGTVISEMCALIDVPNLMDMLDQQSHH